MVAVARVLTIGHSNHSLEWFIALLRDHRVAVVVDVRSQPRSRFVPHFNREALRQRLEQTGIGYAFFGEELGARQPDPACHRDDRADYDLIARQPRFIDGLERVRGVVLERQACLLCAERDPLDCHRTMLVGVRLRAADLALAHILADGAIEEHDATEQRLLVRHRLDQPDLFRDEAQRLAEAYRIHCESMAWRIAS